MAYASLTANKDPRNGLHKLSDYKSSITPFQPKVYDHKKYEDPMKKKPKEYEMKVYDPSKFKPTKLDPYFTLLPHQLPAGRSRNKRNKVTPEQQDKKKKKRVIKPLVFLPNGELKTETNKDSSSNTSDSTNLPVTNKNDKRTPDSGRLSKDFGNPAGSVRRMLKFQEPH